MKAQYKTANGRIIIEVQGEKIKDLFTQIASVQEILEADSTCGVCNGTEIRFQHRKVDDNDFYELACQNRECRARFSFGQKKAGGDLFPRRKGEDGGYLPNRGWSKWEPQQQAQATGNGRSSGRAAAPPPRGNTVPKRTPAAVDYDEEPPF